MQNKSDIKASEGIIDNGDEPEKPKGENQKVMEVIMENFFNITYERHNDK
jgi:hypothetical protein